MDQEASPSANGEVTAPVTVHLMKTMEKWVKYPKPLLSDSRQQVAQGGPREKRGPTFTSVYPQAKAKDRGKSQTEPGGLHGGRLRFGDGDWGCGGWNL